MNNEKNVVHDPELITNLKEYQLQFSNSKVKYLVDLGISQMNNNSIAIQVFEKDITSPYYYEIILSLRELYNLSKYFRVSDSIKEVYDFITNDIFDKNKAFLKELINDEFLVISLVVATRNGGEEEIKLELSRKCMSSDSIINQLCNKVNSLGTELLKQKDENEKLRNKVSDLETKIGALETVIIKEECEKIKSTINTDLLSDYKLKFFVRSIIIKNGYVDNFKYDLLYSSYKEKHSGVKYDYSFAKNIFFRGNYFVIIKLGSNLYLGIFRTFYIFFGKDKVVNVCFDFIFDRFSKYLSKNIKDFEIQKKNSIYCCHFFYLFQKDKKIEGQFFPFSEEFINSLSEILGDNLTYIYFISLLELLDYFGEKKLEKPKEHLDLNNKPKLVELISNYKNKVFQVEDVEIFEVK